MRQAMWTIRAAAALLRVTTGVGAGLILFGLCVTMAAMSQIIPPAVGSGVVSTLSSSLLFGNVLLALDELLYLLKPVDRKPCHLLVVRPD